MDPLPGRRPELHTRLRQVLDQTTEDQQHWVFRAIGAPDPRAALKRLRDACTAAGIGSGIQNRMLIVLRNPGWSEGEKTQQQMRILAQSGGHSLPLIADDLRTFAALETMLAERHPDLDDWLTSRRPAGGTELLTEVLGGLVPNRTVDIPATSAPGGPRAASTAVETDPVSGSAQAGNPPVRAEGTEGGGVGRTLSVGTSASGSPDEPEPATSRIRVGVGMRSREPVEVELATLSKHTVIFAGTGSGKTVLIRRLVEECALRGVSSIVLDPNNDLARLGDPWPRPPEGWAGDDEARAKEYLAATDVVIWTPGRQGGRPLSFQPLPDLTAVYGDRASSRPRWTSPSRRSHRELVLRDRPRRPSVAKRCCVRRCAISPSTAEAISQRSFGCCPTCQSRRAG